MRHLVDRGGQYLINGGIPWRSQLGQVLQEDYFALDLPRHLDS
jgi:hypothetical protein